MDYRKRILDDELDEVFGPLPAIALEGAKGVGKTATAERRATTIIELDQPAQQEIARADPRQLLSAAGPVLLDEWQRVPALWDTVRRAVDKGSPPGPFLLTGSAAPDPERAAEDDGDPGDSPTHSGAGRIDALRMRPMTLGERIDLDPTVSLRELLSGSRPPIQGASPMELTDYTDEILRSGFPAIRSLDGRARRLRLDGYIERLITRDFVNELGIRVRQPDVLRAWMRAYAAAISTVTSLQKIRDAASVNDGTPARKTTAAYENALLRLFILDPVDGWLPTRNHLRQVAQAPKHHLVDPALAAHLLAMTKDKLLSGEHGQAPQPRDGAFLGALFESLVTLSVRVQAQAAEAAVRHLRTHRGRQEIDLIVQDAAGGVLALEVKLSATVTDDDVKHLTWLRNEIGNDLHDAAVITTGPYAYRRDDGIAVIPLALLGP